MYAHVSIVSFLMSFNRCESVRAFSWGTQVVTNAECVGAGVHFNTSVPWQDQARLALLRGMLIGGLCNAHVGLMPAENQKSHTLFARLGPAAHCTGNISLRNCFELCCICADRKVP